MILQSEVLMSSPETVWLSVGSLMAAFVSEGDLTALTAEIGVCLRPEQCASCYQQVGDLYLGNNTDRLCPTRRVSCWPVAASEH